jgi:4-amino-4-deoxy-L-arabinose transferase-like glycosyltransferase
MPKERKILLVIICLAVILRVAAALYMGDKIEVLPGIYDQVSYSKLAENVAAGRGFSFETDWWPATRAGEPTAHWSFLFTIYLAAVYKLVGYHPLAARLLQVVAAGILMPWLTFRLGARMGNMLIGLMAAAISAVYIYFVYYAAALMTETFFFLAVLGALNLLIDLVEKPSLRKALGLGLTMGCAVLLRQLFLLVIPFLLAWICWRGRKVLSLRYLVMTVGIVLLMILPWTVRNYLVFHQFVLLNTNAGYAFFWANHPVQGTNFQSILGDEYPSYQELIPPELLSLSEAALDKELMKRGIQFVLADPIRYILLSVNRLKDYFLFWPKADSGLLSNISRVGSFGIFLPFMLYGLVISFSKTRLDALSIVGKEKRPVLFLLYMYILIYSGIHLLSWSYVRYRLPVDAVLVIFAALGIYDLLWRWPLARRWMVDLIEQS